LEKVFARHYYDNREDAVSRAQLIADKKRQTEVDPLVKTKKGGV
jgi:hypothetical protein